MSLVRDIWQTWRAPRREMRLRLGRGVREDRALATLLAAAGGLFLAQWPILMRAAHFDPSVPLDARLGGALLGGVFILPLIAYVVAAASHLVARQFGGRGAGYGARLALFWALLSVCPLMLIQGLIAGYVGPGAFLNAVQIGVGLAFVWLWLTLLAEAEKDHDR